MSDGGGVQECIGQQLLEDYVKGVEQGFTLRSIIEEHLKKCDPCAMEAVDLSYSLCIRDAKN